MPSIKFGAGRTLSGDQSRQPPSFGRAGIGLLTLRKGTTVYFDRSTKPPDWQAQGGEFAHDRNDWGE